MQSSNIFVLIHHIEAISYLHINYKIIIVYNLITNLHEYNTFININKTIKQKKIIIPYSAIKINANSIPKYSILKPRTNSNFPPQSNLLISIYWLRFISTKILTKKETEKNSYIKE